ncbi:MAG: ankyrin repeat domain-containing protein, partial [Lactococcus sp.]
GSAHYQEIVKTLLQYKANPELRDNNNLTALDYAKQLGYSGMIDLLS